MALLLKFILAKLNIDTVRSSRVNAWKSPPGNPDTSMIVPETNIDIVF